MKDLAAPLLNAADAKARRLSHDAVFERRHSYDNGAFGDAGSRPTLRSSASWDGLARLAYHVEETLLHNEGAPRTIGRTLPEHLTRGASLRTTIFNLVSTMLGSGMLSLPWVFAKLGMLGGLILMLLTPLVGERTISFVAKAADAQLSKNEESHRTLPPVVEQTLGKRAALLCAFALISLNYGVLVSYCIVIKGLLPNLLALLLGLESTPSTGVCLALVAVTCLLPLSSLEKTDQLRYASIASVVLVYVFVACVCVAGVATILDPSDRSAMLHPHRWVRGDVIDWLRAIPVVGFSYLCHMNVPSFYQELRRQRVAEVPSRWPTKTAKFQAATRGAMVVAVVLYLATAVGGYSAFGVHSLPNVLDNLQPGPEMPLPDAMVVFLHTAFVGTMITTFPTISHGLRQSLHLLLYPGTKPETTRDRWLEAAGLVATVVAVANRVSNLGLVFQLVGSTCGGLLTFIFPSCFRLFGRAPPPLLGSSTRSSQGELRTEEAEASRPLTWLGWLGWATDVAVAWASLVLGIVVAFAGCALTLWDTG